jgi:hypothetical protein
MDLTFLDVTDNNMLSLHVTRQQYCESVKVGKTLCQWPIFNDLESTAFKYK